jgi:hypothetical protein
MPRAQVVRHGFGLRTGESRGRAGCEGELRVERRGEGYGCEGQGEGRAGGCGEVGRWEVRFEERPLILREVESVSWRGRHLGRGA